MSTTLHLIWKEKVAPREVTDPFVMTFSATRWSQYHDKLSSGGFVESNASNCFLAASSNISVPANARLRTTASTCKKRKGVNENILAWRVNVSSYKPGIMLFNTTAVNVLGSVSKSDKMSLPRISQSLKFPRFVFGIIPAPWNLTAITAALLLSYLSFLRVNPNTMLHMFQCQATMWNANISLYFLRRVNTRVHKITQ